MRVVINAASAKMGGAVNYLLNFLENLPPPESGHRYFVFLPEATAKALSRIRQNVQLHPLSEKRVTGYRRVWWEQVTLRRFLVEQHVDVLFSTANFGMFHCPARQILLVRNPLYFSWIYEQMFARHHSLKKRIGLRLRRWLCCWSVRTADVVVTPTRAMLDELRRAVEVDPRKTLVNPYGVAEEDFPSQPTEGPTPMSRAGKGSVVRLLYVSLYSEHKNLTTLLKALPLLNANGDRKFLLKTTANPAWEGAAWTLTHQEDIALARRQDTAPWVAFVGPLGLEETQGLYRSADVFVFPSLTESFGHPMAEAMAHGLPIVAADTPVNREVCGDAAAYFSPLSPEDLAGKLTRLASDWDLQNKLSADGWERARRRFRWTAHVRRAVEIAGMRNAQRLCSGPSLPSGEE